MPIRMPDKFPDDQSFRIDEAEALRDEILRLKQLIVTLEQTLKDVEINAHAVVTTNLAVIRELKEKIECLKKS